MKRANKKGGETPDQKKKGVTKPLLIGAVLVLGYLLYTMVTRKSELSVPSTDNIIPMEPMDNM